MPFLPSFCIAFSLSNFDEPPMVLGARAARGFLSYYACARGGSVMRTPSAH